MAKNMWYRAAPPRLTRITPLLLLSMALLLTFSPTTWPVSSVYPITLVALRCMLALMPRRLNMVQLVFAILLIAAIIVNLVTARNMTAILYAIGPVMFYISQTWSVGIRTRRFRDGSIFRGLFIVVLVVLLLLMEQNHAGRYSFYYLKDPNYTSLMVGTVLVTLLLPRLRASSDVILYLLPMGVLFSFTQSRMLFLAILLSVFVAFLTRRSPRKARAFVLLMLFASVFVQLLGALALEVLLATPLLDASNTERLTAFREALFAVLTSPYFLYSGYGNVEVLLDSLNLVNVPHNWFMMMWISNGLTYSVLLLIILFVSIRKSDPLLLPSLAFLITCAAILGRTPLFGPIAFVVIWYVTAHRDGAIKPPKIRAGKKEDVCCDQV